MRIRYCLVLLLFVATLAARAYDFITTSVKWPIGNINLDLQLDSTMPLQGTVLMDGKTSWGQVAQEAVSHWNPCMNHAQLAIFTTSTLGNGNLKSEVFFSDAIYGHRFPPLVLAVTTAWRIGSDRVESDVIFNTAWHWDSYRGPITRDPVDLRRVALHEFGHVLGLDHPDQARQVNVAIMNSVVSDLDDLAEDDMLGARALFPPDQRFLLNVVVEPPGSGTVIVSPPPSLDGKYGPNQTITLTAKPEPRFHFNFWNGNSSSTAHKISVRPVDDQTIVADFSTNAAPRIIVPPRSQFASVGDQVTLQVRVASTAPVNYQWQFNGADLAGQTASALIIDSATHDHSGLYSCHITSVRGEASSKPARLVVDGY